MLTVNQAKNGKFFIMDNSIADNGRPCGVVKGTPYFDNMRSATIAMMNIKKPNIYNISQSQYEKRILR